MAKRSTILPETMSDIELQAPVAMADAGDAAQAALEAALAFCASKMRLAGPQAALSLLATGDANATSYFHYELARQTAANLAGLDHEIKSVYLYDDEATPDDATFGTASPASLVHLIVWAGRKTEALRSLIDAMDRALIGAYGPAVQLPRLNNLLDVQVVDDEDVKRSTGYGAMLRSINHRPLKIWER